jgi:hypothetical protein
MDRVARNRSALEGGRQPFEEGVRGGSWQRAAPAEGLGSGWPSWRKDLRELLAGIGSGVRPSLAGAVFTYGPVHSL